ncbi:PHP domain-containing protein [Treponema sp.]|uniref:PHP domain-containing protein n=1 Tax=Treponema sp. TaxID=166 RepID=UPI00298DF9E8|nr:PHP domain-containing protein [Treponema sp.]MCR5613495.1 PHP domain-containing protein [Treponema sp.]
MIDLHTHSTASDGVLSPGELVKHAFSSSVSVLALTDHDTIDGLDEAQNAADECGLKFVRGVELNIDWPTGEFHLLGLGLKEPSEDFLKIVKDLQQGRDERNAQMIKKMQDAGFDVSLEEILSEFKTKCLGRPHFAAYMVEKKIVKNRQMAFDKYIGKNCPWYVDRQGADLDKAIEAIKNSGGVPVMAHPLSIYVSFGKIRPVFEDLKERGIVGLEAYHPGARVGECVRLEQLARELGFIVTAGSDYHGEAVRADRKIGRTCGGRKIEDRFFEEISKFL